MQKKKKTTSRRIKKNKKKQSHAFLSTLAIFFISLGIFLIIFCGVSIAYKIFSRNQKPVLENKNNEVKKLPKDIEEAVRAASPSATFRVPILLYHYVEYVSDKKDTIRQSLDILPSVFEQQIATLKNAGYTFLTAKDLGDVIDGKQPMPTNPILITVDDGHWDVYTDILPILQKYQAKATAYIIPGFLNGSDFLTTEQLLAVAKSGLIEIGAHTVHHMWLKGRPLAMVQQEVVNSKTMLEKLINQPVVSFAYPFGAFDQQAIDVVKSAGFSTAVSTVPGIDVSQINRYFLYRVRPGGRTGDVLLSFLQQSSFKAY